MKWFIALFILASTQVTYAYVNFIGHSYTSCLNCHYNPTGNGPLNDYGRVVAATAISSGAFYSKNTDEEKIASQAGFLFRKPTQNFLRTQLNYRGFQLVRNPGSKENETKQWINMQADARVILKLGENDKFITVFNYGYSPKPQGNEEKLDEWRSREHYMGYRISPKFGLYGGLMDKAYGLKVIEHNAYSRMVPQVAQNDQTHGVMGHYLGETWEGFLHGFVGNMSQDDNLRMKGGSMMFEKTMFDLHRVGLSFQNSSNTFLTLQSYAAHARLNLKEGSAILAEIGQTTKTSKDTSQDPLATRYGLLQTYLRPFRGLYFLTNIEYQKKDVKKDPYIVRWGPGVQYFPIQRFELRFDIYNTRNFSPTSSSKDSWMYLLQGHLWL